LTLADIGEFPWIASDFLSDLVVFCRHFLHKYL
jgi:hypothetical protein